MLVSIIKYTCMHHKTDKFQIFLKIQICVNVLNKQENTRQSDSGNEQFLLAINL